MTTTRDLEAKMAALLVKTPTDVLIASLITVATTEPKTAELRLAHAKIIDELERRHPAASDAVEAAFDEAEATGGDVNYAAVLIAAIEAEGA